MGKSGYGIGEDGTGGGGGGSVNSVTGNIVDNTDPANPVVTGPQVPISFDAVTGQQTYQGISAGVNYVAGLAGLVAGAIIDQVTDDSAILSPILGADGFITQGVKTITFKAPTLTTGNKIVIFWHLP